jgi:hypothetical protein
MRVKKTKSKLMPEKAVDFTAFGKVFFQVAMGIKSV